MGEHDLLNARIFSRGDEVKIRWEYQDQDYGFIIGKKLLEQLKTDPGQDGPVVMELIKFDD